MNQRTLRKGNLHRFHWVQGDALTERLTLLDENGNAIDLTGQALRLHAKLNPYDAATAFTLVGAIAGDATLGIVDFPVTTTETASVREYWAEIEMTVGAVVETIFRFRIKVERDLG